MILLDNLDLPAGAEEQLNTWQKEVDAGPDYSSRIDLAKRLFKQRNIRANATFRVVRQHLSQMCSGARRCAYCEDSVADEVEHMRPKDLYPGEVFSWCNYVYACGPCNGPKRNQYSVILAGPPLQLVDVGRKFDDDVTEPIEGTHSLIDPRIENPFDFMQLDLIDTFLFVETHAPGTTEYLRAEYTIKVLGLNDRDYLPKAREEAYGSYHARLEQYANAAESGAAQNKLLRLKRSLLNCGHPTVWREMQRQRNSIPELKALFEIVPNTLAW